MHYANKQHKLIQKIAKKQIRHRERQYIATVLTDPVLKPLPGPNSTRPLQPGEDPATFPGSVLAWFCACKLDGGGEVIEDVIVPTQARRNIAQVGQPVVLYKEPTTGAWQVISRADRVNDFQSVKTYTLLELSAQFVKGLRSDGSGGYVTPFYPYMKSPSSVVTATRDNKTQAGLNRGVAYVGSNPVKAYSTGQYISLVPLGVLVLGVDALGAYYINTRHPDGTVTQVKRNP